MRRLSAWVGGGALLVAYLAAANSLEPQPGVTAPAPPAVRQAPAPPDALAGEIASQAERLQARLAAAPTPTLSDRNPFGFGERRRPRATPHPVTSIAAAPLPAPLPPLALMGIAEDTTPQPHRTAIIKGDGDTLYFATTGDTLDGRYEVTAIDVDAVLLKDAQTGGIRRLAMR